MQSEEKREKRMKNSEESLYPIGLMGYCKRDNIHMEITEGEEKEKVYLKQ